MGEVVAGYFEGGLGVVEFLVAGVVDFEEVCDDEVEVFVVVVEVEDGEYFVEDEQFGLGSDYYL